MSFFLIKTICFSKLCSLRFTSHIFLLQSLVLSGHTYVKEIVSSLFCYFLKSPFLQTQRQRPVLDNDIYSLRDRDIHGHILKHQDSHAALCLIKLG